MSNDNGSDGKSGAQRETEARWEIETARRQLDEAWMAERDRWQNQVLDRVVPGRGARRDAQYQALHDQAEKSYEETLAEIWGPAFSLEGSPALPETVESSQRETAPRAAVAPVRELADWAWREEMEGDRDEAAREIATELHFDHGDRDGRER